MAELKYLVIHCTGSPEGLNMTAAQVKDYHIRPTAAGGRGWSRPGYSEVFELDGNMVCLMPYDEDTAVEQSEITFGATGYNSISRHICYVGGTDKAGRAKDTRTPLQKEAMKRYVLEFMKLHPNCIVLGHKDLKSVNKACPSFNVAAWLKEIGVK